MKTQYIIELCAGYDFKGIAPSPIQGKSCTPTACGNKIDLCGSQFSITINS